MARFYQVTIEELPEGRFKAKFQDPSRGNTSIEFTIGELFFFDCPWFHIREVIAEPVDDGMDFTSTALNNANGVDKIIFRFENTGEQQQLSIRWPGGWTFFFLLVE